MLKHRSGQFLTSHRPTWRCDSPISQSLRAECPRISCMGGLAPRPKPIKRCRVFDANLGALLRGLWPIFKLVKVACCKSYLFRPTGGFPSLWLPLLIRRHQRMRSCKECLQQSLPTDIFASLVVSKISKHKSYKFGLWKISYIFISMYRGKARS